MTLSLSSQELNILIEDNLVKDCSITRNMPCFCVLQGLCHCGCKQSTTQSTRNRPGVLVNHFYRFIHGHGLRGVIKTHCAEGHAINDDNVYIDPSGWRHCRICYQNSSRNRYKGNRDVINQRTRSRYIKKTFGISDEDVGLLWFKQCGLCYICQCILEEKLWAIDHNHTTGNIRGILCLNCNSGLGMFKDNPNLLQSAFSYLEEMDGVCNES